MLHKWEFAHRLTVMSLFVLSVVSFPILAQADLGEKKQEILTIDDAPEAEIFAFGKTVIVKKKAKGVLSFGGDVIIEGEVSGDVAAFGGSVFQKEDAFIGGDVIIFGGKYVAENSKPKRIDGKSTVMYAGYEEEMRAMMQDPTRIFSPEVTWAFLAQRLLSVLFWFIVSLALTTITPGAVSRAIVRFRLSTLKVFGIGALGFIVTTIAVMLSLEFLPSFLSVIVGLMAFALLMLTYVFGRVALQASTGKWLMKMISSKREFSETSSLFVGAVIWTLLLSIPYLWTLTLFVLFLASLGLILTARSKTDWTSK